MPRRAGILIVSICALWYFPAPFSTFVGDDLYNMSGLRAGHMLTTLHQILFATWLDKYRPVFFLLLAAEFRTFGSAIQPYIDFNIAVHLLNTWLIFRAARIVSGGGWLVAFSTACMFVTSRFAFYQLWQMTGIVEGAATCLFLLTILAMLAWNSRGQTRLAWLAIAFWAASVFTHERYLVLGPALMASVILQPSVNAGRQLRGWMIASIATVLVSNFALKQFVLGSRFMTATQGRRLQIVPGQVLHFSTSAVLNMLGINSGPDFLSGEDFSEAFPVIRLAAMVLAVSVAAVLLWACLKASFMSDRKKARLTAIAAIWFATAILSASLTFRQEFRWLLAPEIVTLLILAYGLAEIRALIPRAPIVLGLLCLSTALDWHYRSANKRSLYFLTSETLAENVRALILARHPAPSRVWLLTGDPQGTCDWTFGGGAWLPAYTGAPESGFVCPISHDKRHFDPGLSIAIQEISPGHAEDITAAYALAHP